jgi:hypothetical protein
LAIMIPISGIIKNRAGKFYYLLNYISTAINTERTAIPPIIHEI